MSEFESLLNGIESAIVAAGLILRNTIVRWSPSMCIYGSTPESEQTRDLSGVGFLGLKGSC